MNLRHIFISFISILAFFVTSCRQATENHQVWDETTHIATFADDGIRLTLPDTIGWQVALGDSLLPPNIQFAAISPEYGACVLLMKIATDECSDSIMAGIVRTLANQSPDIKGVIYSGPDLTECSLNELPATRFKYSVQIPDSISGSNITGVYDGYLLHRNKHIYGVVLIHDQNFGAELKDQILKGFSLF